MNTTTKRIFLRVMLYGAGLLAALWLMSGLWNVVSFNMDLNQAERSNDRWNRSAHRGGQLEKARVDRWNAYVKEHPEMKNFDWRKAAARIEAEEAAQAELQKRTANQR